MASYLITGASRGLGLALVSRLATMPASQVGTIFATTRSDSSPKLEELVKFSEGRVKIIKLDVSVQQSAQHAAADVESKLQGKGLDYLINNAGIMDYSQGGLDDLWVQKQYCIQLWVNLTRHVGQTKSWTKSSTPMSPLFTTWPRLSSHYFAKATGRLWLMCMSNLPILTSSVIFTDLLGSSTTLGAFSLAHVYQPMPGPGYCISKAALNMLTVQYSYKYKDEGLTFVAVSPGVSHLNSCNELSLTKYE